MKRLLIVLMLLALTISANAQIFIAENEYNERESDAVLGTELPTIPLLNSPYDQFAPVGEGIFLLGMLGGAYLLGKRKREGKE